MNLSVVIPAHNESESIRSTIAEILSATGRIPEIEKTEIIVVDDHSSDKTYDSVIGLGDPRVKCIRLSRTSGSHIAIRAGLKDASGDAVLCISADGQDDPSCIGAMLEKWRKGAGIVLALRNARSGEPWYIQRSSRFFYDLLTLLGGTGKTGVDISRVSFFLMDRTVVNAMNNCAERNTSVFGLIMWLGFKRDFVEYEHRPRKLGRSKWNFAKRLRLASDWIIGFSGLPLTLIFVGGLLVAMLGFLCTAYVITNLVIGNPVQGWACVMTTVLLLSGAQMMMIGIIGEYLWRNLDESRKRPLYFVEKRS